MPQLPVQQQDSQEEASCTSPPPGSDNVSPTPLLPGSRLRGPQPPPVNPLKFIKLTPPVSLFKPPPARELPPPIVQKKEEAEDWQNDLEGWKFNRKKKQEHLMERVSEIKKSEEEQTNSSSRRNKTFSEMMKARKSSIVVYNEGDENDFSEFGLGTKSQSEENSSDEVFQSSENEFTYEKAIQNYVEYASSRGNKPSAANGSETSKTDVVQTQSMSVNIREDMDTQCNTNSQQVEIIEETKIKSKETAAISKSDYTSKENSKLADKINIFENPESFNNFSRSRLENQDETNLYTMKKAAPPVPAKPTKPVIKDEPCSLLVQQEVSVEFTSKVQWNEVDSSSKQLESESSKPSLCVQETTELVYSASPPISDSPSMQQSIQSSMEGPSVEDYGMNHEVQLSPAANSVCNSSLKLTETVARVASLEHVPPRDIQRSPLGGEDSGVHTADSVSQSDEVEDDEELPNQSEDGINGILGILSSQVPIIDHELSALLAPPSRLEPPKEKPPPPPPVGVEPDTETMRKSFLGLEVNSPIPAVPTSEAPSLPADTSDSDCLGNQLKERLLKLEEEKNNVINMEKQLKAEKLPLPASTVTANKDCADSHQERLALEYEALKMERQAISSRKQASFAKKLAVKSLESLDISPAQEIINTKDGDKIDEMEQHPSPPSSTNESDNYHHTNNEIYVLQTLEKNSLPQYYHSGELTPDLQKNVGVVLESLYPKQNIITEKQAVELETKYQSSKHHTPKQNAMRIPESTPVIDQYQKSYHPSSHIQQHSNNYQHKQHSPPQQQQQQTYSPQKKQSSPQQYYIPPTPWYGEHNINNKNYNYEDTHVNYFEAQCSDPAPVKNVSNRTSHAPSGNWSKQPNCISQAPPIRKKGPPPPAKPSRVAQQKIPLTRNYSADSILESLDGDAPVTMRNPKGTSGGSNGGRASLQYSLGGSMSQLPSNNSNNAPQLRQRPTSQGVNYQHWLVQEAEHRRITEQHQRQSAAATLNNSRQPKHLPDAIIMSLTQRVQNRQSLVSPPQQLPQQPPPTQQSITPPRNNTTEDKVLSVSGKKKCSHCNLELGRGAAMIIESLRLFYHIDCFKCCVCCIQLGDGLMGTDVRVRNGKLHCHSCYSSDDGVKFSCV